jgi:hypothetical protein
MTVTLIDLDPSKTPVQVTVARTSKGGLLVNGVLSSGVFGISGSTAYFDTNEATIGEGAALGYDGSVDRLYLSSGTAQAAPNEHLMLMRESRFSAWRTLPVGTTAPVGRPARPWKPLEAPDINPEHVGRPARPWRPEV